MPIFKRQVDSSPNFASLFSFMKGNSSVLFFISKNFYFAQKEPIKVKIFGTFKCSGQNLSKFLCQFWNDKSIPLQILHRSSISWKITPMYFLAQTMYTLLKWSAVKEKFLRISTSQVKISQIPYADFETTSWFLSKFCIFFQFHER